MKYLTAVQHRRPFIMQHTNPAMVATTIRAARRGHRQILVWKRVGSGYEAVPSSEWNQFKEDDK